MNESTAGSCFPNFPSTDSIKTLSPCDGVLMFQDSRFPLWLRPTAFWKVFVQMIFLASAVDLERSSWKNDWGRYQKWLCFQNNDRIDRIDLSQKPVEEKRKIDDAVSKRTIELTVVWFWLVLKASGLQLVPFLSFPTPQSNSPTMVDQSWESCWLTGTFCLRENDKPFASEPWSSSRNGEAGQEVELTRSSLSLFPRINHLATVNSIVRLETAPSIFLFSSTGFWDKSMRSIQSLFWKPSHFRYLPQSFFQLERSKSTALAKSIIGTKTFQTGCRS